MRLRWLPASRRDFFRLYDFLHEVNPHAAKRRLQAVNDAINRLPEQPRVGHRLDDFDPREVRSLIIADYEVRYEIDGDLLIVLRLWHTREDR